MTSQGNTDTALPRDDSVHRKEVDMSRSKMRTCTVFDGLVVGSLETELRAFTL